MPWRLLRVQFTRVSRRLPASRRSARGGNGAAAAEVGPGEGVLGVEQVLEGALGDDVAAVHPGAGADVHQVVGGPDRVLVVLHHDQGVAQVAQFGEGGQEAVVVALVQADAGLVEHVEHAGEAGTDLGGQADPLGLAAGEGHGGPVEAQVVEAHVEQEAQAHADLAQHQVTDLDLAAAEQGLGPFAGPHPHQGLDALEGVGHAHGGELVDGIGAHPHRQGLGPQPQAAAAFAGHQLQVFLQLLADGFAAGIAQLPLQDRQDPLEGPHVALALAVAAVGLDGDRLLAALQQHPPLVVAELVPGGLEFEAVGLPHAEQQREVVAVLLVAPGGDGGIHRQGGVGHHPLHGELAQVADAVAVGAGTVGAVEGEEAGRELLHHGAVHGAGEVFGVEPFPLHPFRQLLAGLGNHLHQGQALAALQGGAQGVGEAFVDALASHQPVDHHLDVVGVVLVELDVVGQLAHLAVDPHPGEAFGHEAGQQLHVGALLAPHHRSQQLVAGAVGEGEDLVHHLVDGLGPDRAAALGAVGFTGPAEQQAEIVLDLGDRADGGAGVVAGRLLVDRDGRREALDRIDIGLVDLAEELAGVGRKALHVAPLTLGEDRVEGEGALAAAAHAGEHHHPVARDGEIHIAQVVLAGAPHPDHVLEAAAGQGAQGRLRSRGCRGGSLLRLPGGAVGRGRALGGGSGAGTGMGDGRQPMSLRGMDLGEAQARAGRGAASAQRDSLTSQRRRHWSMSRAAGAMRTSVGQPRRPPH